MNGAWAASAGQADKASAAELALIVSDTEHQ